MRNKKTLLIAIPGLLIVGCIVIFAIAIISSEGDGNRASEEDKTRTNTNLVGPICQGTPLPDAPAYTQASGTHSLVVLELEEDGNYDYGFINPNYYSLPDGWRARYVKDLELVICVDKEEDELVETCEYTLVDSGDQITLSRFAKHVTFRLLEAQTGREIASDTLVGMPRECQDTEEFLEETTGSSIVGHGYDELEDWLRPYVVIP
ncbi:MAG: hypothetical protein SXV54_24850 [Chloroflexota bacterium]|nr:hypothetical protein [Chloroflexota bacterium]